MKWEGASLRNVPVGCEVKVEGTSLGEVGGAGTEMNVVTESINQDKQSD